MNRSPLSFRRSRRIAVAVLTAGLAAGLLVSCAEEPTRAEPVKTPGPQRQTSSTAVGAAPTLIATARGDVHRIVVHQSPGGPVARLDTDENGTIEDVVIASPTSTKVQAVFLVKQFAQVVAGATWHEVYLPVRPNGSTGWIADTDVEVTSTTLGIDIRLGAHTLTVTQSGAPLVSYPVAVGTAANPTPTGLFYVKELVAPSDPNGVYGPLAYGLSGHSPTIKQSAEYADGVIAIHGTDHPELIGQNVSHGCIRMKSEDILDLQKHLIPLGVTVSISA